MIIKITITTKYNHVNNNIDTVTTEQTNSNNYTILTQIQATKHVQNSLGPYLKTPHTGHIPNYLMWYFSKVETFAISRIFWSFAKVYTHEIVLLRSFATLNFHRR